VDDAVPPAFSETGLPSEDGNYSLIDFPHFCQWFRCPPRTPLHRDEGPEKNKEPLRGCAI
jgi:hypothetical protein